MVFHADEGKLGSIHTEQYLLELVEEATGTTFEDYVEEAIGRHTPFEILDDVDFSPEADLDITTTQSRDVLGSNEGQAIDADDGIELQYISYGRSGHDGLRVGLKDVRDE